ncbi:hypothetical protein O4H52_17700 [Sphingomonadaceae bacterium G21617-S1]|uniref:hypothetical protein n=1 Tax=Sphingomonadales TaxID=204457 RepID=UPI000248AEF2|nr:MULTISPECIES: hypothetical protein [Sphingomonadaceae]MCF8707146.1 hypothetical protein [Rhizorhapis sp. SPR117]MCZ4343451.1 hypothetical protein [Sphingomonadaceae bacterium G21617-S1]
MASLIQITFELVGYLVRNPGLPVAFDLDHESEWSAGEFGFSDDVYASISLAWLATQRHWADGELRD